MMGILCQETPLIHEKEETQKQSPVGVHLQWYTECRTWAHTKTLGQKPAQGEFLSTYKLGNQLAGTFTTD